MIKPRCIKARRNIAAWHDLPESEQRRVRDHAQACPDCRAELEGTRAVLERLEAGKTAYSELRYTGPSPSFREQPALTSAEGLRGFPTRGFWRPLPVALAGALFAVSLAIYLLSAGQPPAPAPRPEPATGASAEPAPKPQVRPPALRPASAAASLAAIRREASRLRKPAAPKRPNGLTLRLPSRPAPPKPQPDGGRS